MRLFDDFVRDCRVSIRGFRRTPGISVAIVVTLGLGIAANVTLAGVVKLVLLRPPEHVRQPEHLVRFVTAGPRTGVTRTIIGGANYPLLLDVQRGVPSLEGAAGYASRRLSLGVGPQAIEVRATLVSPNFFELLGANARFGHVFASTEGFPSSTSTGGPAVAILSHNFWTTRYGGDRAVLGTTMTVGSHSYVVAAVMSPGFRGLEVSEPDVWLPITVAADDPNVSIALEDRSKYSISLFGRVRDRRSLHSVEEQVLSVWRSNSRMLGDPDTSLRIVAVPIAEGWGATSKDDMSVVFWLQGVSALLLTIVCANVANVLLARAIDRQHEFTVRVALGVTRWRIIRLALVDGMLLSCAGALLALTLTLAGGPLLLRILQVNGERYLIDIRLLLFAGAATLITGLAISLLPAFRSWRSYGRGNLGVSEAVSRGSQARTRMLLVGVQGCVGVVLLVGATLFILSFRRAASLDLGLDAEATLRADINLDGIVAPNEAIAATYDEMLRKVRELPEVVGAALANSDPFAGGRAVSAHAPGQDADFLWNPTRGKVAIEAAVGDGFFSSVGSHVRGRDFARSDDRGAPRVAVVNTPLARVLYPNEDALGRCVILPSRAATAGEDECVTIVGVLAGVWYSSIVDREKPMVYIPLAQRRAFDGVWRPRGVFVRMRAGAVSSEEKVRVTLQSVRSDLPAVRVTPVRDLVAAQTRPWRVGSTVFGLFGGVALIIVAGGLYGAVAFAVSQRSYEVAVRFALGASRRHVMLTVCTESVSAVVIGLVAGMGAANAARRWIAPILFQSSPKEITVVVTCCAFLLFLCAIAAAIPAAAKVADERVAVLLR